MDGSQVLPYLQAHYPYAFTACELVRDSGSLAYRVTGTDCDFFFRDVKPAFSGTARHAAEIQLFLAGQGVPVPRILPLSDGRAYHAATEADGIHLYVLVEYLEGSEPDMEQEAAAAGELVGLLHTRMKGYPGTLVTRDQAFFIDRYLTQQQQMGYPEAGIERFRTHGDILWDRVRRLPRGYCHGDLYVGNLHRTADGRLYLLDLDTSCHAFPLFDIALICNATDFFHFRIEDVARTQHRLAQFLTGYEKVQSVSRVERKAVFDLLGVYHYQLQATIVEIHGLGCVDHAFLDRQYDWLMQWEDATHGLTP